MDIFKQIARLFRVTAPTRYFPLTIRCQRCGELVQAQVDLYNELSWVDTDDGAGEDYVCRKVLVGSGRCYQTLEVQLRFDKNRRLTEKTVSGGEWVEPSV